MTQNYTYVLSYKSADVHDHKISLGTSLAQLTESLMFMTLKPYTNICVSAVENNTDATLWYWNFSEEEVTAEEKHTHDRFMAIMHILVNTQGKYNKATELGLPLPICGNI